MSLTFFPSDNDTNYANSTIPNYFNTTLFENYTDVFYNSTMDYNGTTIDTSPKARFIRFIETLLEAIRNALFDNDVVKILIFVAGIVLFIIVFGFQRFFWLTFFGSGYVKI